MARQGSTPRYAPDIHGQTPDWHFKTESGIGLSWLLVVKADLKAIVTARSSLANRQLSMGVEVC